MKRYIPFFISIFALASVSFLASCERFISPIDAGGDPLAQDFVVEVEFARGAEDGAALDPDYDGWAAGYAEAVDDGEGLYLYFSFVREPMWYDVFLPAVEAYVAYEQTDFPAEPHYFDYFSRGYFEDGRQMEASDGDGGIYFFGDWEVVSGSMEITERTEKAVSGVVALVMLDSFDFRVNGNDTAAKKTLTIQFNNVPIIVYLQSQKMTANAKNQKYSHHSPRRPR